MAHMIDFETGQAAFAHTRRAAWHALGSQMSVAESGDLSAAMTKARVNFLVDSHKLFYKKGLDLVEVEDAQGIYRTDTGRYLATVGGSYNPIQNHDAFSILDPLIAMGCKINAVGSIKEGRNVWMLIEMPNAKLDVFGDVVDGYICVKNAHDGTAALRACATGVRVVCNNTMELMEASPKLSVVSIRHTKSAKEQVAVARQLMEQMYKAMEKAGETFRSLAEKELEKDAIKNLIESTFPMPEDRDSDVIAKRRIAVADLIFNGTGNKPWAVLGEARATAWAVLNGFTEYLDHERYSEAKSVSAKRSTLESSLFGANNAVKNKVLRQLVAI